MKTRDWQRLSAYLDGELSERERRALEERLAQDTELAAALEELSKTRSLLRELPRRTVPRDFAVRAPAAVEPHPSPWARGLRWGAALGGALCVLLVALSFVLGPSAGGLAGATPPSLALQMGAAAPSGTPRPEGHGGGPEVSPVPTTAAGLVPGEESPAVATPKRAPDSTAVAATPTPEMYILAVPSEPSAMPGQAFAACAPPAPGSDAVCAAADQGASNGLTSGLRLAGVIGGGLALIALAISVLLGRER
mgnify:CR=1 FL=1|jgi:anti-sigma factor RsiW